MSMPCKDCSSGTLHEGTPTGRVETVHGLPTYIADPPNGQQAKGIIVHIPDAFGWELVNNRNLSDNYAQRTGCKVLLPDFMDGHWVAHDLLTTMETITAKTSLLRNVFKILPVARTIFNMVPFMYLNRLAVAQPRIFSFFKAVREQDPGLPVGAAGFCWGGLHVFKLVADTEKTDDGKSLIDAGFTAHPSMLTIPQDAEAVKLPISVSIGDVDMALAHEKSIEAKKIIESKGPQHEYVIIPGAKHGFAIRGNPNNEDELKQGIQAEDQAVEWFKNKFGI